jgi:hypothetical protein
VIPPPPREARQALGRRLAGPSAALAGFVERLRSKNDLKNDDVTLVMIDLKP